MNVCILLLVSRLTSTRPPLSTTSLNNLYMSSGCFAIIGILVMGVPVYDKGGQRGEGVRGIAKGDGQEREYFVVSLAKMTIYPVPFFAM